MQLNISYSEMSLIRELANQKLFKIFKEKIKNRMVVKNAFSKFVECNRIPSWDLVFGDEQCCVRIMDKCRLLEIRLKNKLNKGE